jgi:hypothetical protein
MTDDDKHVYVYGITEQTEKEIEASGVNGAATVYTVSYGRVSALVSDIDTTDPDRSDEAVAAHDSVIQSLIETEDIRTIVPMGFGMAFKTKRTLRGVIRGAQRAFVKTLNDVEGCIELGVKVVSPGDGSVSEERVKQLLTEELSTLSAGETDDDLFSDRLLANRSYLVSDDDRQKFDDAIDRIDSELDDTMVKYTGPWAPYSFVDIQIGAEASR